MRIVGRGIVAFRGTMNDFVISGISKSRPVLFAILNNNIYLYKFYD